MISDGSGICSSDVLFVCEVVEPEDNTVERFVVHHGLKLRTRKETKFVEEKKNCKLFVSYRCSHVSWWQEVRAVYREAVVLDCSISFPYI